MEGSDSGKSFRITLPTMNSSSHNGTVLGNIDWISNQDLNLSIGHQSEFIEALMPCLNLNDRTVLYSGLHHPVVATIYTITALLLLIGGALIKRLVTVAIDRANYDILMYKTSDWLVGYTTSFFFVSMVGIGIR